MFKTTIVIWSEFDPSDMELTDLGWEASSGDAYASVFKIESIDKPEADPDWDGTEFFGIHEPDDEADTLEGFNPYIFEIDEEDENSPLTS